VGEGGSGVDEAGKSDMSKSGINRVHGIYG
jgi:hypothetical protein